MRIISSSGKVRAEGDENLSGLHAVASVGAVDARPGPFHTTFGRPRGARSGLRSYRQAVFHIISQDWINRQFAALAVERPIGVPLCRGRSISGSAVAARRIAGVHERSCMEGDRAAERWLVYVSLGAQDGYLLRSWNER